jgi:serine/threonine-protein kinase RIO1
LTVHAVLAFAGHDVIIFIIAMGFVAALVHADLATYTTIIISLYKIFW